MAIVGTILQEVIKKKKDNLERKQISFDVQELTLRQLINKAKYTEFGMQHHFAEMISSSVVG